jgi:hypothetical protein
LAAIVLGIDAWTLSLRANISGVAVPLPQDPFAGLIIFTAIVTLLVISYDLIAPQKAPGFYHVYAELIAEFFLVVFWLASFALAATYAQELSTVFRYFLSGSDLIGSGIQNSINGSIAIAVLGAVVFLLALANLVFLTAYIVQRWRARRSAQKTNGLANISVAPRSHEPPGFLA